MTRNNTDFQGFIRLHRGVPDTSVEQLLSSPRGLGKHWSSDEFTASAFAQRGTSSKGAVITGLVHPDDLMTPEEIAEHNKKNPKSLIYTQEAKTTENEVPVRPGSVVHVVEGKDMTFFDEPQVKKQRAFKTPRQSRA